MCNALCRKNKLRVVNKSGGKTIVHVHKPHCIPLSVKADKIHYLGAIFRSLHHRSGLPMPLYKRIYPGLTRTQMDTYSGIGKYKSFFKLLDDERNYSFWLALGRCHKIRSAVNMSRKNFCILPLTMQRL